uniref:Uncharacterized protein n=1 Tax=Oryza punctata TaxID=4537 RepID=A0A0E0KFS4_ORYPU
MAIVGGASSHRRRAERGGRRSQATTTFPFVTVAGLLPSRGSRKGRGGKGSRHSIPSSLYRMPPPPPPSLCHCRAPQIVTSSPLTRSGRGMGRDRRGGDRSFHCCPSFPLSPADTVGRCRAADHTSG